MTNNIKNMEMQIFCLACEGLWTLPEERQERHEQDEN